MRIPDGCSARCRGKAPSRSATLGQVVHRFSDPRRVDVRERLRDVGHLAFGEPERLADLADRAARAVRIDHRDARDPFRLEVGEDVCVNLLAARALDVEVDVGQLGRPVRVHEPLEDEVVLDGVDLADVHQVADERAGRRPAARRADPMRFDALDDVGNRQEVAGEPEARAHLQLGVEQPLHLLRARHPPPLEPFMTARGEQLVERALRQSVRHRVARHLDHTEPEGERALLGDPVRLDKQLRPPPEQRVDLLGRLQRRLVVTVIPMVLGQGNELAHRVEHIAEEPVGRRQRARPIRRHRAHTGLIGQPQRALHAPAIPFLQPRPHFDDRTSETEDLEPSRQSYARSVHLLPIAQGGPVGGNPPGVPPS